MSTAPRTPNDLLSAHSVRPGREADGVDNVIPRWIAAPRALEEIVSLIDIAKRERLAVVCRGGKTSLSAGNVPRAFDLGLDAGGLNRCVERRPEDMTITVEAGMTVAALGRELEANCQRIAWDPDLPERATVGGVLAANSSGGLAYGFGQPRDLVLGMTFVDGRGRVLRVGGRVVKNVAGYDLVRLFAGSHGSLGFIAEATLRTHPLPELSRTLYVAFTTPSEADAARAALFASDLPLAALDLDVRHGPPAAWVLQARVEGSAREIEFLRDRVGRLCRRPITDETVDWRSPLHSPAEADLVVRIGAKPAESVAVAQELYLRLGTSVEIGAGLGDGTLRISAHCGSPERALSIIREIRTIAQHRESPDFVERIMPDAKRETTVWNAPPTVLRMMSEIKTRFDPDAVFAPGRFVGGL